jgi:hypothetical protein
MPFSKVGDGGISDPHAERMRSPDIIIIIITIIIIVDVYHISNRQRDRLRSPQPLICRARNWTTELDGARLHYYHI